MEKTEQSLFEKFPPSKPCSCEVCRNYCARPGWWTVKEAAKAIDAGYANRMMLEMAPDLSFGVLSPAFKGCEANFALTIHAQNGCTFLKENLCELFGKDIQPLECRYCHHDRIGMGEQCHLDLETDWNTPVGQAVIAQWGTMTGLWERNKNNIMPHP
jgi:hypothetical protein